MIFARPRQNAVGLANDKSRADPSVPNGTDGRVAATFRACPERIEGLRNLHEIVMNSSDDGKRPPRRTAKLTCNIKWLNLDNSFQ